MENFNEKGKIVVANWKMKLNIAESIKLAEDYKKVFADFDKEGVGVCPDYVSLIKVAELLEETKIKVGAQDVSWETYGAYTGEIPANTIVESGCKYVIIGHSERRKYQMENYEMIHKKTKAVLDTKNLVPIVCVGENWDERKTDRRDYVLYEQIQQALTGLKIEIGQQMVVAYEPIWAIGTGTSIEPAEAEYAHKVVRITLNEMFGKELVEKNFKIIYGGSIDSSNVDGFTSIDSVDGLLVGGASLKADEFSKVVRAIIK